MSWYLAIAILIAAGAVWLLRHMRKVEPERVEITHKDLYYDNLPESLDGLRLCHASDLHITADTRNSEAVADALRSVEADLYLLTGDLIHGPRGIAALDRWLSGLAELIRPAFAVLGNAEHKRQINTGAVIELLRRLGVTVLNNEATVADTPQGPIQIIGLDDPHSGHSNPPLAYSKADSGMWTLVLVHSPEGILGLEGRRADLVLSGHTHGGQIILPGIGWISDNTHHSVGLISGWYDQDDIRQKAGVQRGPLGLYVSRGLGTSGWPLRLRCRPELALLTLRRS